MTYIIICLGCSSSTARYHAFSSSGVVLSIGCPLCSPRRKQVCNVKSPLNCLSRLRIVATCRFSSTGMSMRRIISSVAASNLRMRLSQRRRACTTSGRPSWVELDKTDTFAFGQYWSRSAQVSSMMPKKSGCSVGSPFPLKVMTSRHLPFSHFPFAIS